MYNLNSKKLGFDIPFEKLEAKQIPNLILSDPITCAQYYDHCMKCQPKQINQRMKTKNRPNEIYIYFIFLGLFCYK